MPDDDLIDQMLTDAMSADVPQLSEAFDARLMRRIHSRRVTMTGWVLIGVYAIVTTATAAWLMRDVNARWIVEALLIGLLVSVGTGVYGRRILASS